MRKKLAILLAGVMLAAVPTGVMAATPENAADEILPLAESADEVAIDETNFPNSIFRNYVETNFDTDGDEILSAAEIAAANKINVDNKGITSLQGVEFFTELEQLDCAGNRLNSLDVSQNTKLTRLYCDDNNLGSLDVSNNPALFNFDCASNRIRRLDLSKNPDLQYLYCNSNNLSTLDLSKNPKLLELSCSNNSLDELDLSQNTALRDLSCQGNHLVKLDLKDSSANINEVRLGEQTRDVTATQTGDTLRISLTDLVGAESVANVSLQRGQDAISIVGNGIVIEDISITEVLYEYDTGCTDRFGAATMDVALTITEIVESDENADKTDLENEINDVEDLTASEYTTDSWNALQNALAKAQAVAEDEYATQDEVDEALLELETAKNNLQAAGTEESYHDGVEYVDGRWGYYIDNVLQTGYTGVANKANENGWWYIKDGYVDFDANTVARNNNGWWYVLDGKVQFGFTGLANYSNENGWWYIVEGKVDFNHNGVDRNQNGWWYVTGGQVQFGFTGLANYKNENGWWYIKEGQVDFNASGVYQNVNGWWYVTGGKVDFGFTGIASNQNGSWYLKGGQVQFGTSGTVRYNGRNYTIRNGQVV